MADGFDLSARLSALRARYPEVEPEMVADVVRAVLATMSGDLMAKEAALVHEVGELGRTVARARAEIAAIRVDDINESHIPSATDELDAIVAHTAAATEAILECCEALDVLGPTLSGPAGQTVQDVTTKIYEACGFQDITGQRITKVVATLKEIESRVAHIVGTFDPGKARPAKTQTPAPAAPVRSDADLLNGPQLPTAAMDQSDIDALLASFD